MHRVAWRGVCHEVTEELKVRQISTTLRWRAGRSGREEPGPGLGYSAPREANACDCLFRGVVTEPSIR
jgi:hypothetical protein